MMTASAAATDLKQIDSEMQAILAELLMPGPPPSAVQAPLPFPAAPDCATSTGLLDNSQILPQQLLPASGLLLTC